MTYICLKHPFAMHPVDLLLMNTTMQHAPFAQCCIELFCGQLSTQHDYIDGKEFVAILSYVYSTELEESTRKKTKKIVKCIQEKMEEMNYRFYDSHRDFDQGCKLTHMISHT